MILIQTTTGPLSINLDRVLAVRVYDNNENFWTLEVVGERGVVLTATVPVPDDDELTDFLALMDGKVG
jgi:hypothetical protein